MSCRAQPARHLTIAKSDTEQVTGGDRHMLGRSGSSTSAARVLTTSLTTGAQQMNNDQTRLAQVSCTSNLLPRGCLWTPACMQVHPVRWTLAFHEQIVYTYSCNTSISEAL